MTFQQLRELCVIAEHENVTAAARALFISQPALSMSLKNIETEVGTVLFDRHGKNIALNQDGRDFYDYARRTLAEFDAIQKRFRTPVQSGNPLRICYSTSYIPDYVIPAFSASRPDIPITINEAEKKMIPVFLLNGTYDMAISGERYGDELVSQRFYRNRLMVSVPTSNPLSKRSAVSLKDLDGQTFFRLSKCGEFSEIVDVLAKNEGIALSTVQRVNYEVIKALQTKADFLYFITTLQAEFDYTSMNRKLIPMEGDMFIKDMYIYLPKKNSSKAEPLICWAEKRFGAGLELI